MIHHHTHTQATVLLCLLSAVLLVIAPEQPAYSFSGRVFTFYPALGFLLSALLAAPASLLGCWALWKDSKGILLLVRDSTVTAVHVLIVAGASLISSPIPSDDNLGVGLGTRLASVVSQSQM